MYCDNNQDKMSRLLTRFTNISLRDIIRDFLSQIGKWVFEDAT